MNAASTDSQTQQNPFWSLFIIDLWRRRLVQGVYLHLNKIIKRDCLCHEVQVHCVSKRGHGNSIHRAFILPLRVYIHTNISIFYKTNCVDNFYFDLFCLPWRFDLIGILTSGCNNIDRNFPDCHFIILSLNKITPEKRPEFVGDFSKTLSRRTKKCILIYITPKFVRESSIYKKSS